MIYGIVNNLLFLNQTKLRLYIYISEPFKYVRRNINGYKNVGTHVC